MLAVLLSALFAPSLAYLPEGKDAFMSGVYLRELANRMGKPDLPDLAYMDFPAENRLPLGVRSIGRDIEEEQLFPIDYDSLGGGSLHPSIRDQEFLEHGSLYRSQYASGAAGEAKQNLKNVQPAKTESTLPAYCNPPNPCPVGYTAQQGCIEEFENSAAFSRQYQAAQDCMCDTEHMFECSISSDNMEENEVDSFLDMDFNRFLQQINSGVKHKNLMAKKFHASNQKSSVNPFLSGERLPVAAKKGKNVVF